MKTTVEHLENGLTVVLRPSKSAPVVAYQMWVGVGSADERKGEEGLAHVFEHMIFKGTERRPVGEIARDVERAGGHINAWTSHDETVFFITLASRFWPQGLDILADAVTGATLDAGELARELTVIREEIRMGQDSPDRAVIENLFGSAYRRHPYGRPVIGYDRVVKGFTRPLVADFYRRWYVPSNMVFVAAGDFEPAKMMKQIQAAFGAFSGPEAPDRVTRVVEPKQRRARSRQVVKPVSEAQLAVGFPVPGLLHDDVPALDLLAAVIGQGASSRLENRIRRGLSLVNSIRAIAYTPKDAGLFGIFADLPQHQLVRATGAIAEELARVTREPVSLDEVSRGRTLLESDKVYSEETVEGVARKLGYYGLHARDVEFESHYLAALANIGPEELLEVAGRYLAPGAANVSVVVPDPSRATPSKRVPWISGRGAGRKVDEKKLAGLLGEAVTGASRRRRGKAAGAQRSRDTEIATLPSGDVLIVRRDPASRLVAARAAFLGGQRLEPAAVAGISSLVASTLTRGTRTRSGDELAERFDALACSVGGFSGRNTLGARGEFLRSNFAEGFALMGECLRTPSFPPEEVLREREMLVQELEASRDNPGHRVFERFQSELFGAHPYGRTLEDTEETVARLSPLSLAHHLEKTTGRGSMVLAVVGGVDMETVRALTEEHLAGGGRKRRPPRAPARWKPPAAPIQATFELPKEQSHVVIGFPGTTLTSPDRFALDMLMEILGGHGGRLFEEIREKRGLAYSVAATGMQGIEPGYVAFYAGTTPGQEEAVVEAMIAEAKKIRDKAPSSAEVSRIRRHMIGTRAIANQRAAVRAANMALDTLYGNGHDASERYPEKIDKITGRQIRDTAARFLDLDSMIIACVGPDADSLGLL